MTRHQRAIHRSQFERLCFLRTLYSLRGAYDSVSCISVEAAIQAAEASLAQVDSPASVETNQPAGSVEQPTA